MTTALRRIFNVGRGDGLKAQLVRGALGVGGLKLLSLPLTLGTSILLARGLGPEGYGQYVFIMAVISLLSLPVGRGLGQLITREVAKFHHSEEWSLFRGLLRGAHQWVLFGSAGIAAVIVLLAARNASWAVDDRWTLLFFTMIMLPLLGLNALRGATLRGLRNVFYSQLPELLVRPGLHLVIAGALLIAGMLNPATALGSQIVATAFAFGVGAWFLSYLKPDKVGQASPEYRYKEWGWALLPFTLLAAINTLSGQVGILVLGWQGTDAEVAGLRVAQNGAMLVMFSLTIANLVIGPHITRAHRENDKHRLQQLSRQSARSALVLALPVALPLIFFGGGLIHLVFGLEYKNISAMPMVVMSVAQLVYVALGPVAQLLVMTGYEKFTLVAHLVALLINVCLAVILVPLYGVLGAAGSMAIGLLISSSILSYQVYKKLSLRPSIF